MDEKEIELFVPGRLCLFGEHSDWAGGHRRQNPEIGMGYTLVAQTNQGTYARVRKLNEPIIRFKTVLSREAFEVNLKADELLKIAEEGGLFSYVAGVVHEIISSYSTCDKCGIEIDNYKTDLPIKKGLSSSASICVLITEAFDKIYNLRLTRKRIMEIAYLGETTTPSRCGKMDQACAYDNPIMMIFDGDRIRAEELKITKEIPLLVVNLMKGKNTLKILADLNKGFPWASNELEKKKQMYLGEINRGIVMNAKKALEEGDIIKFGIVMNMAQDFFDDYLKPACPEELEAPVLHSVLSMPDIRGFIHGGKCVGSGGDGAVQLVCKSKEDREKVKNTLTMRGLECIELDLKPTILRRDNLGMLVEYLYKKVPVYAYVAKEGNIDIGTIDLLKKAEEEVLKEKKDNFDNLT